MTERTRLLNAFHPASTVVEWRGTKTVKTGTDIFGFDVPHLTERARARERKRGEALVWHLPVSGPPINGKTFPGRFQRADGNNGSPPPPPLRTAHRKATHPSVFVPSHYSRVAAPKLPPRISETLIARHVRITSLNLFLSSWRGRFCPQRFICPENFLCLFRLPPPRRSRKETPLSLS